MGIISDQYNINKKLVDINEIKKNSNNNKDFQYIKDLIKEESFNNSQISSIFKFLKIKQFFLGLQKMEVIYEKYKDEFKKRDLKKEDSVHASLLFSFSNDCNYFFDYFPGYSNDDYIFLYKNEKRGLRYKPMTKKEFISKNNVCIIKLKSDNNISLYKLFDIIIKTNEWKYDNYNLEKNNCCHFAKFILKTLDSKLYEGDTLKDIIFTMYIDDKKKNDYINSHFPKIFLNYFEDLKLKEKKLAKNQLKELNNNNEEKKKLDEKNTSEQKKEYDKMTKKIEEQNENYKINIENVNKDLEESKSKKIVNLNTPF